MSSIVSQLYRGFFLIPLLICLLSSCEEKVESADELRSFTAELEDWQEERYERLISETGWINLAGLFWLDSTWRTMGFGPDSDFELQYGEGPETILIARTINDSTIDYMIPEGLEIFLDTALVSGGKVFSDEHKVFSYKNFRWFFIERDGFHAIRVRDLDHPKLDELPKLKYYDASLEWKKEGTFTPYNPTQLVEVPNVLGRTTKMKVIGELEFFHNDQAQKLVLFEGSPERGFLIFADNTNGDETYGGGRYLYLDIPRRGSGEVEIDFNRAYSPPCEFTDYATCAFPPAQNILDFKVEAGEKSTFHH